MRRLTVSPSTLGKVATLVAACYALLVVTGGAVRLTGSGLGCADWPTCSHGHLIASASFHPLVEFTNRCVTIAVSIVSVVAFLATVARTPRRKDLVKLGAAILAGLAAQIVLGGLVVLFKLNPYLVALHFVLTLVVLAFALVLRHRNRQGAVRGASLLPTELLWLSRLQIATLSVLVLAGTVVTGAGPHAGGPGAKRIDVPFEKVAELHSTIALFLIGLTLASLFALRQAKAPAAVQQRARWFLELLAIQGALGYTQYFLHDSAPVVEFHLAGVTVLWCVAVAHYLGCFEGRPEMAALAEEADSSQTPAAAGASLS